MTILCQLLAAANIALIGVLVWRERIYAQEREKHRAITADLLDRVMARSYGEYVASHPQPGARPIRRRTLSDAEMAELEQRRIAGAKN